MHVIKLYILFPDCLFPLHNLLWTSVCGHTVIWHHPFLWLYKIPLFGFNQFTRLDIHVVSNLLLL